MNFEQWKASSKVKVEEEKRRKAPEEQVQKAVIEFVKKVSADPDKRFQQCVWQYLEDQTKPGMGSRESLLNPPSEFIREMRTRENAPMLKRIGDMIEELRKSLHIDFKELGPKILDEYNNTR